jgi:hypothetical protein
MGKAKGKTVTYKVTLTERDAASFLIALDHASENGQLADPFDVQMVEKDRAWSALQREDMVNAILRSDLNDVQEKDLNEMDSYELDQHLHQLTR